jgi:hypothetical protein
MAVSEVRLARLFRPQMLANEEQMLANGPKNGTWLKCIAAEAPRPGPLVVVVVVVVVIEYPQGRDRDNDNDIHLTRSQDLRGCSRVNLDGEDQSFQ